jgi:ATP-dependent RNA helicase DeaD
MAINGDVPQATRERTVEQLKSGKLDILVATDVAARGLDVERISHVVNFDIPIDTESYVHRIGRTGRAGRSGAAISFVTPRERRLLDAIERATRQPLTQMQLPSVEDVNVTRLARFDEAITEALSHPDRILQFRAIVGHYIEHHDVPEADVAAALAVVAQGDTPLLLSAEDERAQRYERDEQNRKDRAERGGRIERGDRGDRNSRSDRGDRGGRPSRDDRYSRDDRPPRERFNREDRSEGAERRPRTNSQPMGSYRIEVGKRHKVEPRQIVGALANEGGLSREDFGAIKILPDHSIVQLPASLSADVFSRLENTRISGKLIELREDRQVPGRREDRDGRDGREGREGREGRDGREGREERRERKPRTR